MAFLKRANAMVVHPRISHRGWGGIRKVASSGSSRNLTDQAQEILGEPLHSDKHLVTHCTIVASVDVDTVPGIKLGNVKVGSKTVDRRYADYYIKPQCSQFVNNNGDSWSRDVLRMAYPTFIGAHNFQEHVQIEEQSKGRIIDAAARDIGDSLYIDILVATDRKHAQLVQDIEAGKMATLSMGCFLPGTMVSMADGTRVPIEDIQPGDMVLTHKGRSRQVVNQQIRRRDWTLRHIDAVGVSETISATDTHPFFVFRAPEVCACGCGERLPEIKNQTLRSMSRRFKRGHDKRVFNPMSTYSLDEHRERTARLADIMADVEMEEVRAADLKVGDFLCFPRAQFDGEIPSDGVTEGRARLLGYYLAEGSLIKYKGAPTGVEFCFSFDEQDTYCAEVADLLRTEFPGNEPRFHVREDRNTCTVILSGADTAQWFLDHGGEYSHRKRLHPDVVRWPVSVQKALVGAWFNGDGTLTKKGVTEGVTTSYDLASQMHLIASRCGAFVNTYATVRGRKVAIREVVNGGAVVRDEATGRFPAFTLRMGQTQAQVFAGHTDKVVSDPHFKSQGMRVTDDVVMFPITAIEDEPYFGFVYDLEVEEDHSYVVEGVAVHNCTTDFSICSQCGHFAVDETQLCDHIKYAKLNTFLDDSGQKRVIAELCGHKDYNENPDAPGGVRFIEASWVAVPAFPGAVMRNILAPGEVSDDQVRKVLASVPPQWSDSAITKAANLHVPSHTYTRTAEFDFGGDEGGGDGGGEAAPEKPTAPFQDVEDALYESMKTRLRERIEKELAQKNVEDSAEPEPAMGPNDNVIKEGSRNASMRRHAAALGTLVRVASSPAALVEGVARINASYGIRVSRDLYRTALSAGIPTRYSSPGRYLHACRKAAGRDLTPAEVRVVVRVGTLLAHWAGLNNPPT